MLLPMHLKLIHNYKFAFNEAPPQAGLFYVTGSSNNVQLWLRRTLVQLNISLQVRCSVLPNYVLAAQVCDATMPDRSGPCW